MKDKLATRVAQLSTAIRKRGHAGFATTYVYEPIDFLEVDQGSLYAVFEIEEGSGAEGLEIADLISGVLRKEYYRDLNREPFSSLEAALHQINEELSGIAAQNNVGWIGKLNAAVAVLEGQMLHVSHVGKAAAYLLRSGKLTNITKGLDDDSNNPLKTFANIATGDLAASDKVLLSTGDLLPSLHERHVASIFAELSPARTIGTIAEELDDKDFERIGAVFVEVLSEDQLSRQYVENDPDEIILERGGRLESLRESAMPAIGGIAGSAAAAASKARAMAQNGAASGGLAGRIKAHGKHKKEVRENEERFHDEFDEEPVPSQDENRPITEKFKETNFTEKAKNVKNVGTPLVDRVESMLPQKLPKVSIPAMPQIPFLTGYIATGVLALVLLISILALSSKYHHAAVAKKEVAALQRSSLLEQSAGAAILTKQYDQANQAIKEARASLASVSGSKDVTRRSEAAQISSKLDTDQELASQVTIEGGKPAADFTTLVKGASPVGLTMLGGSLYTADANTGAIYKYNPTSHAVSKVASGNQTHPITAATRSGAAIFLTKPAGITEVSTGGIATIVKPTFGSWPASVIDIASFNGNLYLLDPDSGTLYKAVKTAGSYANPTVALDSSSGLKGAKAVTIDGNVYILQKNNSIVKFNTGANEPFALSGLPQPLKNPNRLLINANLADLYILDPGTHRIVVTDEKGAYLKGYASEDWSHASGLWADEDKGLIWVLSSGKLYQFPM